MRLLAVEPVSPFLLQNRGAPMSGPSFSISGKPVTVTPTAITNGVTFWPDLDLAEFQKVRTLPADLPPETAGVALLAAIAEVNDALADVVTYWNAKACERAADVPGTKKRSTPAQRPICWGSSPPSGGVNRIRGRKARTPAPACWPRRPT